MLKNKKHRLTLRYLTGNLAIVVGLVLIWRGIWYMLDWFDLIFFASDHLFSAIFGIVIGVAILYIPDKNLDELKKL
jgi:ABC-type antimicrobial peptide transport system permease subunit